MEGTVMGGGCRQSLHRRRVWHRKLTRTRTGVPPRPTGGRTSAAPARVARRPTRATTSDLRARHPVEPVHPGSVIEVASRVAVVDAVAAPVDVVAASMRVSGTTRMPASAATSRASSSSAPRESRARVPVMTRTGRVVRQRAASPVEVRPATAARADGAAGPLAAKAVGAAPEKDLSPPLAYHQHVPIHTLGSQPRSFFTVRSLSGDRRRHAR
jgi:hypothetical protein